jgi:hypothetical protein
MISSFTRSTGSAVGQVVGKTVSKTVGKNVFVAVGLAFTVIDMVNLVQEWNKSLPTIDMINNFIKELKSEANLVEYEYNNRKKICQLLL